MGDKVFNVSTKNDEIVPRVDESCNAIMEGIQDWQNDIKKRLKKI